jgi:hypothetical protein
MFDDKQKYLRDLISNIKRLTTKEKHHILSIFKKYNVEYTKNANGYFFNLDKIDYDILDKVYKCVNLIEEKRELITTLDKKRDSYLEYYKNLIENKLKETINKKRDDYIKQLILTPSDMCIKKKSVKRVIRFSNLDPDILMKEHSRPKKYHKNSVYFRLNQKIVALSRRYNRGKSNSKAARDGGGGGDDDIEGGGDDDIEGGGSAGPGIDIDIDIDGGDGDDDINIEGLDDELKDSIGEEYVDETSSNLDDYGDGEGSEFMGDDEYYKDSNSDIETENKTEKTDKSERTERTENKTRTIKTGKHKKKRKDVAASYQEVDYYKSLLKKSGFKFDDDKCVQIKLEVYIE